MYSKVYAVAVTTDGSGAATGYAAVDPGEIQQIAYVPATTNALDTNADIAVSGETTGIAIVTKQNIGTVAFTLAPRQPAHAVSDGSALLYAAAGTAVTVPIAIAGERIKIVVAQGSSTKSGTFYIYMG